MKITNLVRTSIGFALMAVVVTLAAGCKKSQNQPSVDNSLYGGWAEINTGANSQRSIYLEPNANKFIMNIPEFGVNTTTVSTYTGTFTVKNDSLKAYITEEKVTQNNVPISSRALNFNVFEKGTYSISNNRLTVKYISYPADAPVLSEATFQRQLPD